MTYRLTHRSIDRHIDRHIDRSIDISVDIHILTCCRVPGARVPGARGSEWADKKSRPNQISQIDHIDKRRQTNQVLTSRPHRPHAPHVGQINQIRQMPIVQRKQIGQRVRDCIVTFGPKVYWRSLDALRRVHRCIYIVFERASWSLLWFSNMDLFSCHMYSTYREKERNNHE